MDAMQPAARLSPFMASHLADFFDKFGMSFSIDGPQLEYFVFRKETGLDISCSVTIGFEDPARQIEVMTFYPGLNLFADTRYLSSVCFFMVMQHFANFHHLGTGCLIRLNTHREVFDSFYALLKDFDFQVKLGGGGELLNLESRFLPLDIDTSMFDQRALPDGYAA